MYDLNDLKYDYVTQEILFSKVSQEDVFLYYIGAFVYGRPMNSPLRRDKRPSWAIYMSTSGPRYKDFSTGEGGSCINFVMNKFGLRYFEALDKIYQDLLGGTFVPRKVTVSTEYKKTKAIIQIKSREFSSRDAEYWHPYGISAPVLKYFKVFPCLNVWTNGYMSYQYKSKDPAYAYMFKKDDYTFKIYRPLAAKEYKWRASIDKSVLQGWDQLPESGELLILTKSLKDVMVLRVLGYPALAIQSESVIVKKSVMGELKSRFKNIIILMDFDKAGVHITNVLRKKYNLPYFFLQSFKTRSNGIKDISDYRKANGIIKTKELLKWYITSILEKFTQ